MDKQPLTITMTTDVWDETKAKIAELEALTKSEYMFMGQIGKHDAQVIRDMVARATYIVFAHDKEALLIEDILADADKLERKGR